MASGDARTEAPTLPPSPLSEPVPERPPDRPLPLAAILLTIPAFAVGAAATAVLSRALGFQAPTGFFEIPAHLPFMVSGAVIADRLTRRLDRAVRWAMGMGLGAVLSATTVDNLPRLCCPHDRDVRHFIGETMALLVTGVLAGALMGLASRARAGRRWKLLLAGIASQTMLLVLATGVGLAGMMPGHLGGWAAAVPLLLAPALPCVSGLFWGVLLCAVMLLALLPEQRAAARGFQISDPSEL